MNIAITNGLTLTPPAFHAGLRVWSQQNGRPGETNWHDKANASIVSADQDFGACLEIQKQADTTRLRFSGETPMIPRVYLRISARVKRVAGPECSVRIAGWAGDGKRAHVTGLRETGPQAELAQIGEVVEVTAIVGVGSRKGVDMPWGTKPVFGHFGLDLIGANGGTIRVESIEIEDVTAAFVPSLIDWVDVKDYGAKGDGITNDRDAFIATDKAANGGTILVPEGTYFIDGDIGINAPIRFKGKLKTTDSTRVVFLKSFDFPTYADAFGDETLGFKKALQALLGYSDHTSLDLCGRRIELTEPLLFDKIAPQLGGFSNRRAIKNGSILVKPGPAWQTKSIQSEARYNPEQSRVLSNVTNIAAIEIGSLVRGSGVGREVYVSGRNLSKGEIYLSQPLYAAAAKQNYSFTRFRYMFDMSGLRQLDRLSFIGLDIYCENIASFMMLPAAGERFLLSNCNIFKPKDRGITSIGRGCQDLVVDECQFDSGEIHLPVTQRDSVAINTNANDTKIRNNRFARFAHFMVAAGTSHIITGNHWFQGDGKDGSRVRMAGLVLTMPDVQSNIVGNYVDNAGIEWTNEHSAKPNRSGGAGSFNNLIMTGNTFLASHINPGFSWLVVKPYGKGHTILGMNVSNNAFKAYSGKVGRIDRVDTSIAELDRSGFENVHFEGNTFSGVDTFVANPLKLTHQQNTAAKVWTFAPITEFPFNGTPKSVKSVVAETALIDGAGKTQGEMPWVRTDSGARRDQISLNWSSPLRGRVSVYARMDRRS